MQISLAKGKYHAVRHITCAFGANIDLHVYNFPCPLSLALYVRISIAVYGKYRAAMRHITCAFGANIDLHKNPLIHRRRDGGPPSPPCFANGGRSVECVGLPQQGCERRWAHTKTYVPETEQPRSGKMPISAFCFCAEGANFCLHDKA